MAVLQSTGPEVLIGEELTQGDIHPTCSGQSSGDSDVNAYCEDKLRSLREDALETLAEVSKESIGR